MIKRKHAKWFDITFRNTGRSDQPLPRKAVFASAAVAAYRFFMHNIETSRNADSGRPSRRTPWVDLIAFVAILAFGIICTVVAHESVDEVSEISDSLIGLIVLWLSTRGDDGRD